jgi:hypothetical protein
MLNLFFSSAKLSGCGRVLETRITLDRERCATFFTNANNTSPCEASGLTRHRTWQKRMRGVTESAARSPVRFAFGSISTTSAAGWTDLGARATQLRAAKHAVPGRHISRTYSRSRGSRAGRSTSAARDPLRYLDTLAAISCIVNTRRLRLRCVRCFRVPSRSARRDVTQTSEQARSVVCAQVAQPVECSTRTAAPARTG